MRGAIKIDGGSAVDELPTFGESGQVSAAEGYEWWAATYDHAPNPLLAREERYLSALLPDLYNKTILDLACGTGRWLERLLPRSCRSGVGIDYSSAMLRVAGEKPAIRGRLARAGCESLPLPSDCFDLAICSFAAGHIHDMESVARELGRVMKAGADVFVTDLHSEAYARGWRVGFRSGVTAVQIETHPRTADEIVRVFGVNSFQCEMHETLWLGEPERPIFERAGKLDAFIEACRWPAVLVCHFRRDASSLLRTDS
jgi:ubiquinone/menaquinone biosynthesis C-methylase UbiE